MSSTMISLCYVSKLTDTVTLYRIADYINGDYVPYKGSDQISFYDFDRNIIYGYTDKIADDLNTINVYEWYPWFDQLKGKWKTDTKVSETNWIEVIETDRGTPEDIMQTILKGWYTNGRFGRQHDVLFACKRSDFFPICVYLPRDSYYIESDKICIKKEIEKLDSIKIDIRDARSCMSNSGQYINRKYLMHKTLWNRVGVIFVKEKDEIVQRIVNNSIQTIARDTLSRKEKQRFIC